MRRIVTRWPWIEIGSFLVLIVVAALFRMVELGQIPPAFFPDEANMALDAQSILQGHFYLITPHEGGEGALYAYLLALTFALFGTGILQARMLTAVVSVISVGAAFVILQRLLAPRLGGRAALAVSAFAGLGLSIADWYVTVSRQAFPQPLAVLVQSTCLAFVWWSLHSGRRAVTLLAGLLLGLTAYTYVPGKLTPIVLLLYFLLDWAARGKEAFLVRHFGRLVTVAAIGGALYAPLLATLAFRAGELGGRAGQFTFLSPSINQGDAWGTLLKSFLGNVAGFLPFIRHVAGYSVVKAMDDLTALLFLVGLIVAIWRWRRPEYLLLVVWWGVMLVPSIIAPEGAIPHLRRAIGTAVPTFALTGLGLFVPVTTIVQRQVAWRRLAMVAGALLVAFFSLGMRAERTYRDYYLGMVDNEAVALINHIYDFELAEVMTAEGDGSTGYVLPVDSASGALFPESSTLAFLYQGQAAYSYVWDDETSLFDALQSLAKGKTRIGLVRWKVTKHTGADPKHLFDYVMEKWGVPDGRTVHQYFDVDYFRREAETGPLARAVLTPIGVSFEGRFALEGAAWGETGATEDILWAELAWRKTGDAPANYQVALWLEDQAGHVVGQVDRPLLNNLRHQGTSAWTVGAEERDYYLLQVDPGTPPGTYRLKAVLYGGGGGDRRLAPSLPGIGADLAVTLGEVALHPPLTPLEVAALPIPQRLDLDARGGLQLLGFDPGFTGPLRPGDRATLSLWWQVQESLPQNLGVIVGIGQGERAWALSKPQPLGGAGYPSRDWPAGAVVRTFVDLRLPPDVETGDYNLGLRLLNLASDASSKDWLFGEGDLLVGRMQVTARTRIFEVPPIAYPVGASFGEQMTLLGYDLDLTQVEGGKPARLTLYWQAQGEMDTAYTVFVHLLDESGNIVAQVDREPQAGTAPTTGWLAGEVVGDEIEIPISDAIASARMLAIGLYDPLNGQRLQLAKSAQASDNFQAKGDHLVIDLRMAISDQ